MKKWLQNMLVCPQCLPEEVPLLLEIETEKEADVIQGVLKCMACEQTYVIQDGVAVVLPQRSLSALADSGGYNSRGMMSSYLWSHYSDLFNDPLATDAYAIWSSYFEGNGGYALDIGCSVGRLSFELAPTHSHVIGIDTSRPFVQKARELMQKKELRFDLLIEGLITEKRSCELGSRWNSDRVEFIVADAMALPFPKKFFTTVASVNILEKVPNPMQHLVDVNRVLRDDEAVFVFSDPFSWDEAFTDPELWLSGKTDGKYACRGVEAIGRLFAGEDRVFDPPLNLIAKRDVPWKIRKTENLWEHINSQLLVGKRK